MKMEWSSKHFFQNLVIYFKNTNMTNLKNLENGDAIAKLKELAKSAKTCMFCTDLKEQPIPSRPMALRDVDDEGNLWFISGMESIKNAEILKDNMVQLFFSNTGSSEYLSIYGIAHIYNDRDTIEEKWSDMANAWFEGKDDPQVSIIRVSPKETKYWDTEDGKVITLLKLATSTITGNKNDEGGVEGELNV